MSPTPDSPRHLPPAAGGISAGRSPGRVVRLASMIALAGLLLPLTAAASPPDAGGRFADLPSPDEIPAPAPANAELAEDAEPEPESSPPEDESSDDDDGGGDEAEDDGDGDGDDDEADEPKVEIKRLDKAKWIKHTIIPGERIDEIADRYQVRKASLIRWNKLDPKKPKIFAGRSLAVYTKFIPPPQQQIIYTVEFGDTWNGIAKQYRVDPDHLRTRWNSKVPRKFKAGQEIVIWVDPLSDPDLLRDANAKARDKATAGTSSRSGSAGAAASKPTPALPLVKISKGSVSVGKPNRGKIVNSIVLPENKPLYTVRKPDEAFGSTHTLHNLQLAIANFRQATGYSGELVIGAISKQGGGRLRPHSSHQSGRDVDIRLPVKRKGGSSDSVDDVDWDAAWGLIQALVATGEIQYIFLSANRQKHLHKAAKRAGASKDMLERIIQYPRKSGTNNGIVRHEKGHTAHIHVRFTCAANETRCESY